MLAFLKLLPFFCLCLYLGLINFVFLLIKYILTRSLDITLSLGKYKQYGCNNIFSWISKNYRSLQEAIETGNVNEVALILEKSDERDELKINEALSKAFLSRSISYAEKGANWERNALMQNYFNALATGDMAAAKSLIPEPPTLA